MSKALSNPKLFAAATVLFALATLVNMGAAPVSEEANGLANQKLISIEKSSPTIPPDPWSDPPTARA